MMSSSNSFAWALPAPSNNVALSNTNPSSQVSSSSQGPMSIFWDIENCPVPSNVKPQDVAGNIRTALRVHPIIDGAVRVFSAYGDFNAFPRRLREGCQRTGVKLIDVPNGRKDAADKAILVDMFLFALDNPPPSSIMLISGDVDFAPALHVLGQRGYTIILVIPSGVNVSSALSNAGRYVWDWPSIARGVGFLPPAKPREPRRAAPIERSGFSVGCQIDDNEEESIVYQGVSNHSYNTRDFSMVSHSQTGYSRNSRLWAYNPPTQSEFGTDSTLWAQNPATSRTYSVPSNLSETQVELVPYNDQNNVTCVQPGDLNGLKLQLTKLLESSGGNLPLNRLPSEYQKSYGRPLYVSEYGKMKLKNLLKKMEDVIAVDGTGQMMSVRLCSSKSEPIEAPVILARRDSKNHHKKGKEAQDIDVTGGSSEEFSDEERVVIGGSVYQNLDKFRCEVQEILVIYSGEMALDFFEAKYHQRYGRQVDYLSFGVNNLEQLLELVRDVAVLQRDPVSKMKVLVAVGC